MLVYMRNAREFGSAPRPCTILEVQHTLYGARFKVEWADGRKSGYLHSRHFRVVSYA